MGALQSSDAGKLMRLDCLPRLFCHNLLYSVVQLLRLLRRVTDSNDAEPAVLTDGCKHVDEDASLPRLVEVQAIAVV